MEALHWAGQLQVWRASACSPCSLPPSGGIRWYILGPPGWASCYPPSILKLFLGKSQGLMVLEALQVPLVPSVAHGVCSPDSLHYTFVWLEDWAFFLSSTLTCFFANVSPKSQQGDTIFPSPVVLLHVFAEINLLVGSFDSQISKKIFLES